jgi:hypothetical protein
MLCTIVEPKINIFLHSIELQREIKESLHRKPSTGSSVEDIAKLSKFSLVYKLCPYRAIAR